VLQGLAQRGEDVAGELGGVVEEHAAPAARPRAASFLIAAAPRMSFQGRSVRAVR